MHKTWDGVPTQFINDLDPYKGGATIPAPLMVEMNSDAAWQDFQDSVTWMDAQYEEHAMQQLKARWS